MKSRICVHLLCALPLVAGVASYAPPRLTSLQPAKKSDSFACHPFESQGRLEWQNVGTRKSGHVALDAHGSLYAVRQSASATELIVVQFDQCDFAFMGLTSGSSRNRGGSMGAPLEYFGHVRRVADDTCLTVEAGATHSDPSVDYLRGELYFRPCQLSDNDEQLRQSFVYMISASADIFFGFVGAKNTTQHVYNGPKDYDLDRQRRIRVGDVDGRSYSLTLEQSS